MEVSFIVTVGEFFLIFYDQQFKEFLDRWDHSYQGESCPLPPSPFIFNPTVGLLNPILNPNGFIWVYIWIL